MKNANEINSEMIEKAQQIIDFKLNLVKYSVRRVYRSSTSFEKLSCSWMNKLSDKVRKELKDVLVLVDGSNSMLSIAVAAMDSKKLKAKLNF